MIRINDNFWHGGRNGIHEEPPLSYAHKGDYKIDCQTRMVEMSVFGGDDMIDGFFALNDFSL